MMTTITTTIENNSYWNNIPSDQFFDIDELFASDFQFNQNCSLMKEDSKETSSSHQVTY
jgi:hypothetical protein